MNVVSILLSEYAKGFEGSRLVIVGTFNQVRAPQIPFTMAMFLTVVIEAHRDERGSKHLGELFLLNARREEVAQVSFEIGFSGNDPRPGMHLRHTHLQLVNVTFPEAGPYSYELHIDGTYHAATNLYIGTEGES